MTKRNRKVWTVFLSVDRLKKNAEETLSFGKIYVTPHTPWKLFLSFLFFFSLEDNLSFILNEREVKVGGLEGKEKKTADSKSFPMLDKV